MKRSIFIKLLAAFVIVVVALSGLILVFSFKTIRARWTDREAERLESLGRVLAPQFRALLGEADRADLEALVRRAGGEGDVRITIIGSNGLVIADSTAEVRTMESHHYRPEILSALAGQTGVALRRSPTVGQQMLYVGLPLEEAGRVVGVLRISLYLKDIDHLLAALRGRIVLLAAAAMVVLLAGALLFARHVSRPIRDLTEASRRVAAGDFQAKVHVRNKDELRNLAESFNAMTIRLKTLFEEAAAEREELSQVVGSIREGLMVIGPDDRILMMNRSCRPVCRLEDAVGKYFWEVVRHPGIQEFVGRAKAARQSAAGEFMVEERRLRVRVVWVPSRERRIVTILDLTEAREPGNE